MRRWMKCVPSWAGDEGIHHLLGDGVVDEGGGLRPGEGHVAQVHARLRRRCHGFQHSGSGNQCFRFHVMIEGRYHISVWFWKLYNFVMQSRSACFQRKYCTIRWQTSHTSRSSNLQAKQEAIFHDRERHDVRRKIIVDIPWTDKKIFWEYYPNRKKDDNLYGAKHFAC